MKLNMLLIQIAGIAFISIGLAGVVSVSINPLPIPQQTTPAILSMGMIPLGMVLLAIKPVYKNIDLVDKENGKWKLN